MRRTRSARHPQRNGAATLQACVQKRTTMTNCRSSSSSSTVTAAGAELLAASDAEVKSAEVRQNDSVRRPPTDLQTTKFVANAPAAASIVSASSSIAFARCFSRFRTNADGCAARRSGTDNRLFVSLRICKYRKMFNSRSAVFQPSNVAILANRQ